MPSVGVDAGSWPAACCWSLGSSLFARRTDGRPRRPAKVRSSRRVPILGISRPWPGPTPGLTEEWIGLHSVCGPLAGVNGPGPCPIHCATKLGHFGLRSNLFPGRQNLMREVRHAVH
jgi:hypothetical protein